MSDRLHFDRATHTYRLGSRVLPSVTQILEDVGIIDYSQIPVETRQMALERGSAVHEAIALDLQSDLDESSAEESGILGYVHAAREARRALGVEILAVEEQVYHPVLDYAGTLDLRSADCVIDWKTTRAEYWVRFQLAAYVAACAARTGITTRWSGVSWRRICVELHCDGTYRIYEIAPDTWCDDFTTFVAALRVWREKQERRKLS